MTKTPIYKRPLFILIATLAIGALIGASVTGLAVRNRLENIRAFAQADGYARLIEGVLEPVSAEQRQAIDPIIASAGQDVEQIIRDGRIALNQRFEQMEQELEPHLTPEQRKDLERRQALVQERYGERN